MVLTEVESRTHMEREIFSQPECWRECLDSLEKDPVVSEIVSGVSQDAEWIFVGCGTSYYLAQSAAASFSAISGRPSRALPASEILLFPEIVSKRNKVAVLFSRSGRTTEAVKAMDLLNARDDLQTITVTCAPDSAFASRGQFPLVLAAAYEQSTVMTRSFSSMLMGLQFLAAKLASKPEVCQQLAQLPRVAKPLFEQVPEQLQDFVASHDFDDYAYLGQGPFYGLACEAALKVMESSCSYAQSFHSLEFRHGPKSVAGPKTLVGFFISETGYSAEVDLLEEVQSLGSKTFVISPNSDTRVKAAADVLIEVAPLGLECTRLPACIPWGQLLGLYTGLKKGLNPDSPPNLSQVVILDELP
ncbi:MAG TPA: SIS domain-containing protein [Terriglobales bacterium]|nr:SIS domain-containing protein [Terriglobales bacterium]